MSAVNLFGRSEQTEMSSGLTWTLLVADQLVEACQDWTGPVEFRFEKQPDGRVEAWFRTVDGSAMSETKR